ncbi:MAG: alkaline phosphatase [Bacteroidota bacterium]
MKIIQRPLSVLIACALLCMNCSNGAKAVVETSKKPLNIILMIGDGMGLAQISAASFINGGLTLDLFTVIGLVSTSSSDDYITDSAAGATAYSAGVKTYNGAIGLGPDSLSRQTILEMAEAHGLSTGLVATCSMTHATPGSFFAHQKSRNMDKEIANDFYKQHIDVMIGGGKPYFDTNLLKQNGYTVATGSEINWAAEYNQYVYFFNDSIHPPKVNEGRGDFLLKGTQKALQTLSKNKKGFFLMVEGSQIDWGGHDTDFNYTVSETIDFDKAVKAAYEFAKKDGNTLVIVTADHETGGLSLTEGSLKNRTIKASYANTHHSGIRVPVYAYGPGAENFAGTMENIHIFDLMKTLYGF